MNNSKQKNTSDIRIISLLKANSGLVCFFVIVLILISHFIYWFFTPQQKENTIEVLEPISEAERSGNPELILLSNEEYDYFSSLGFMIHQQRMIYPDMSDMPDIQDIPHISKVKKLDEVITYEEQLPHDIVEHKNVLTKNQKARIAIVVDDMGGSVKRTAEIIGIKAPLTASFLTFAPELDSQVKASQKAGHEIMIHVPMQPQSDIYVSEDVLKVSMSQEEIYKTFKKMLGKFKGVKGINNHMGSRFTEHGDKLEPVMNLLAENNLFFLDSKTTPKSQAEETAEKYNVPYVHRHVFLDNNNDFNYIMGQLKLTERIALKNGYAVAICHPKSQTSKALKEWVNSLKDKKIELVPLSVLVDIYS